MPLNPARPAFHHALALTTPMLWIIAAGFALPVAALRIVTRRGSVRVWWAFYTASLITGAFGLCLFATEHAVNAVVGVPNLGFLLAHLCLIAAAGLTMMFLHTIRSEIPDRAAMVWQALLAFVVGLLLLALWTMQPIHTENLAYRQLPVEIYAVLYNWTLAIYYGGVLLYCAICTYRLRNETPLSDRTLRVGFAVNTIAAAAGFLAVGVFVMSVQLAYSGYWAASNLLLALAEPLVPLSFAGFVAGAALFALGPTMQERARARRLIVSLTPLWRRLRELYPAVAFSPTPLTGPPTLRAGRMLIEIGDGLALLRVEPGDRDAIGAVAHALTSHDIDVQAEPAAGILPTPATTQEEEQLFVAISDAYVTLTAAGAAASNRQERARL